MALPRVVVVGLGPGGHDHVTDQTRTAIASSAHRFLRTSRHPSSDLVPDATTFDELYETADSFVDVYAQITEALVAGAVEHGEVLYAVPGSPLILERSVRHLRADSRVECVVLPAMSFLDVAYTALGIDPVEAGVRLVDGHEFATAAAGERGPLLVAHCHANWVLSDIKLAVDDASDVSNDDLEVVLLQRLGTPDELITHTTWAALDTTVEADHLTSIYIPRLGVAVAEHYARFHALARTLREQCPWDIEQTHASLVPYLLEETYEVVDALAALDPDDPSTDEDLIEELGDLLYQIEFHATIAEQQGRFTIADITQGVHDKLVRRHPHVFGDTAVDGTEQVLSNWETIKREEKQRTSIFDGIPMSLPSLSYAYKTQKKAAGVGFDWPDVTGALPKIAEEADEVIAAHASGDKAATADELGDLLFSVVNVARHLKVDPEVALRAAVTKFRTRFEGVERLATERGIDLHTSDLAVLDELWDTVKSNAPTGHEK
ncbi:MAG: putative MazG family protein [Ilumatobacteraceae bacterium]|nr:putative MazG family protein [Ilumatobacteraceae bacterium]